MMPWSVDLAELGSQMAANSLAVLPDDLHYGSHMRADGPLAGIGGHLLYQANNLFLVAVLEGLSRLNLLPDGRMDRSPVAHFFARSRVGTFWGTAERGPSLILVNPVVVTIPLQGPVMLECSFVCRIAQQAFDVIAALAGMARDVPGHEIRVPLLHATPRRLTTLPATGVDLQYRAQASISLERLGKASPRR